MIFSFLGKRKVSGWKMPLRPKQPSWVVFANRE